MDTSVVLLIISGFLIIYSYVLYPFILLAYLRLKSQPESPRTQLSYFPLLSVVVAAHNEEQVIEEKISNTFSLDYPKDCLEFLIGSDGSTDQTDAICRRHSWVHFLRIEPRGGKANVLNTLIPHARGEIIILSDANTIIEPGALTAMIRHFDDPTVGGVCGRLVLTSSRQRLGDTERSYWNYESKLKELESSCYSTIGANGGIYALRKTLFVPIPADTIIDDFLISINLLEKRKRLLFEYDAVAYEEVSKSFQDEFWRKVRIGAGNMQVLLRKWKFFFKAPTFVTFACLSHKVIRWFIPILLIVFWICSLLLSGRQPFDILFWGYNLTLLLSLVGIVGMSNNRLILAFSYLYSFNLALLIGYGRYLLGLQRATWRRAKR